MNEQFPKFVTKIAFNNGKTDSVSHNQLLTMATLKMYFKKEIKENNGINQFTTYFYEKIKVKQN